MWKQMSLTIWRPRKKRETKRHERSTQTHPHPHTHRSQHKHLDARADGNIFDTGFFFFAPLLICILLLFPLLSFPFCKYPRPRRSFLFSFSFFLFPPFSAFFFSLFFSFRSNFSCFPKKWNAFLLPVSLSLPWVLVFPPCGIGGKNRGKKSAFRRPRNERDPERYKWSIQSDS